MGSWLSTSHTSQQLVCNCKKNTSKFNDNDDILHKYRTDLAELQKQNDSLKALNHQLHLEIKCNKEVSDLVHSKSISMIGIDEYVEKMLLDPNVNINYLPDFVERQLYRNVLKMILGLMDHVLKNSHVNLLNHEIHFDVKPVDGVSH